MYNKQIFNREGFDMKRLEVTLENETGLHARPASLLVKEASKYKSNITIELDGQEYVAKSIMSVKHGSRERYSFGF